MPATRSRALSGLNAVMRVGSHDGCRPRHVLQILWTCSHVQPSGNSPDFGFDRPFGYGLPLGWPPPRRPPRSALSGPPWLRLVRASSFLPVLVVAVRAARAPAIGRPGGPCASLCLRRSGKEGTRPRNGRSAHTVAGRCGVVCVRLVLVLRAALRIGCRQPQAQLRPRDGVGRWGLRSSSGPSRTDAREGGRAQYCGSTLARQP